MSNAAARYYAKNREAICARMRERDAERRAFLREEAADPEFAEELREEWREKYHRGVESKITRQLRGWLDDPEISATFKAFVRECVWDHRGTIPPVFLKGLARMSIAVRVEKDIPVILVDGAHSASGASGASGGEEDA